MRKWRSTPLAECAAPEANSLVDGPFGSDLKVSDYTESGVRILQLQNLGDGFFVDDNMKFTSERKAALLSRCNVRPGDLIVAKMADPLARAAIIPAHVERAVIVADLIKLRPAQDIDRDFLCAAINGPRFRREAERLSTGTTRTRISLSTLKRIPLLQPSSTEQGWIGEVVRTIDDAIDQTKALIAKTQQIKAGLMHDLLTRGVTPVGQLRPLREEAPNLYTESPLGWIPKAWAVQPCSELTELITVGIVIRPAQYYVIEGVPAFRSANIREDGIDPADLVYISPRSNSLLAKSQVRTGDVLSVRTGYPGTSAVVPSEYAGANCIDILLSRPCSDVRSAYLAAWINSSFGKEQVLRKQGGLAQQHFNVRELRDLLVALPSAPEQDEAIARFRSIDDKLAAERAVAQKYATLKRGLMHDLLTGRVRVPVPDAQKVAANV